MTISSGSRSLFLLLFPLTAVAGTWMAPAHRASLPAPVLAVADAYDRRDWPTLGATARAALADPATPAVARARILEWVDSAQSAQGAGRELASFALPPEITWLKLAVRRYQVFRAPDAPARVNYALIFSGHLRPGTQIEQLQVIGPDGQPALDLRAGIGEFDQTPNPDGTPAFWFSAHRSPVPPADGLYGLTLKMAGSAESRGFVIATRLVATDSPIVLDPEIDQAVTARQPTFRWRDYRSSLFVAGERRKLNVTVFAVPSGSRPVWELGVRDGARVTARVGEPGSEGVSELVPGPYLGRVTYSERRDFGPVVLSRESGTHFPFAVGH